MVFHPNMQRSLIEKQVGAPGYALPGPRIPRGNLWTLEQDESVSFTKTQQWSLEQKSAFILTALLVFLRNRVHSVFRQIGNSSNQLPFFRLFFKND